METKLWRLELDDIRVLLELRLFPVDRRNKDFRFIVGSFGSFITTGADDGLWLSFSMITSISTVSEVAMIAICYGKLSG
jgi:hypothetical protein